MTLRISLEITGNSDSAQGAVEELTVKTQASDAAWEALQAALKAATDALTNAGAAAGKSAAGLEQTQSAAQGSVNALSGAADAATRVGKNANDAAKASTGALQKIEDKAEDVQAAATAAAGALTKVNGAAGGLAPALQSGAKPAADAIKLTNHELNNLQFQMQDISQGLLTGQSPFRVILQQGSQIVQLFGPRAGIQAAMRAFGGAVVSYVSNPLNIALLGMAAAAGAAQLLATRFFQSGDAAEEKGEKVLTLKDAMEELDEATGRLNKSQETEIRQSEQKVSALLNEEIATRNLMKARLEAERARLQSQIDRSRAPGVAADVSGVGVLPSLNRISDLEAALEEQEAKIRDAQASLRGAVSSRLESDVQAAIDPVHAATRDYERAREELIKAFTAPGSDISQDEFQTRLDQIARARDAAIEKARKDQSESRKAAPKDTLLDDLEGVLFAGRQAARGAVADLQTELDILREANPVQQDMIRLREQLAFATEEQRLKIEELLGAIHAETTAQQAAEEARAAATASWENVGYVVSNAIDAIAERSRKVGSALKEMVVQLAAAAAQALLIGQGPLAGLFGGGGSATGGGGSGGGLGGWLGKLFGGGRRDGGDIDPNKWYWVGEDGPEVFAPDMRGTIIPNHRISPMAGYMNRSGGGESRGPGVLQVNVTGARGNREIADMVEAGVRKGVAAYDKAMPLRFQQIASDPRLV